MFVGMKLQVAELVWSYGDECETVARVGCLDTCGSNNRKSLIPLHLRHILRAGAESGVIIDVTRDLQDGALMRHREQQGEPNMATMRQTLQDDGTRSAARVREVADTPAVTVVVTFSDALAYE